MPDMKFLLRSLSWNPNLVTLSFNVFCNFFLIRVQIASSGVQPAEVVQLLGNVRACWAHPPVTIAVVKAHQEKVDVAVTPGLAVCLEILLQHSFANVREIKKAVTVLIGKAVCLWLLARDRSVALILWFFYILLMFSPYIGSGL
jgi:hypothetical protein